MYGLYVGNLLWTGSLVFSLDGPILDKASIMPGCMHLLGFRGL